jgi:hypothetical protein
VTPKAVRSERIMFRLTEEEYRQLEEWAKRERRSLSNLVYLLVGEALRETTQQPPSLTPRLSQTDTPR